MFGFSQTKEIDSLKAHLTNTKLHDTVKIKTYFALAGRYGGYSLDSLKKYTMKAVDLSKLNNDYFLESAYFYMGLYHSLVGERDKSKEYYLKVIALMDSIKIKDKTNLARVLSNYAGELNENAELDEKITYNLRALKLRESVGDKREIGKTQFSLAVTYSNTGFDSLSVNYLKLALKNAEGSNEKALTGFVLNSLIMYALKNKNLKEAEIYLQKSEAICKETGSNRVCYNTYLRKGEYLDKLKRVDEAEDAFLRSLKYAKERKVPGDISFIHARLGKHYVLSGKPIKAIENFRKFEENKKDDEKGKISEFAYLNWSRAEGILGNYKKSNKYLKKYVNIKDSLNSQKNKIAIANAESKYQSEKKDKEIAEQQLSLVDQKLALTESKSKTRIMSILIVSLLSGSMLLWFLFQQRQKRIEQQLVTIQKEQEVLTLESLMEGEEKERFRIAKELHDGVNVDLSAIKYKLTSLLEKNNQVINEVVTMIDKSCEQVRAISHNLVPPSLKDFSLIETLEDFCNTTNSLHKPEVLFNHIGETVNISKKAEVNIFRIVQELINNSIKHAQASEIDVQISHRDNIIQLTVEDNGVGFDTKTITSNGIGLQNVQSRVDYLQAKLDFNSNEKGTSYIIDINTDNLV